MSIDGVAETKSTSRSLEVMSIQFMGCKEVYPCLISRPEIFQKKRMKAQFEAYISNFLEEMQATPMVLKKVVLDAPERATCRKQKMHGGYYSCDVCIANPENMQIPGKRGSKNIKLNLQRHLLLRSGKERSISISSFFYSTGKRVFLPYMRFSERRTHEETRTWANEAMEAQLDHVMGITGLSVFFEAPNFDVVLDMMPEPMHMLDGGFMKNTCG